MNRIRNVLIRGAARQLGDEVREVRLRDVSYIERRMMKLELPGRRKRGRPRGGLWIG